MLFPPKRLREEIERVSSYRELICDNCEFNSIRHDTSRLDRHCIICGCTISAKVRCLSCRCPHDPPLWEEELTEEEEDDIGDDAIE